MKMIRLPTPTGNLRQPGHKIDTIVIHAMSEYFEKDGEHMHATKFLNSIGLSCHYMVTPGGSVIECAPPDSLTAWHARGHNIHSIGIEILMPGLNHYDDFIQILKTMDWISNIQSNAAAHLCGMLCRQYGLSMDDIKFHYELDPDRKVDPGQKHDWPRFLLDVQDFAGATK